jgi:hypothetical protein
VLETVRDCTKSLQDAQGYTGWTPGQCRGQLSLLELAAMRAMARRAGMIGLFMLGGEDHAEN